MKQNNLVEVTTSINSKTGDVEKVVVNGIILVSESSQLNEIKIREKAIWNAFNQFHVDDFDEAFQEFKVALIKQTKREIAKQINELKKYVYNKKETDDLECDFYQAILIKDLLF